MSQNAIASEPTLEWSHLSERAVRLEQLRSLYANTNLAVAVTMIAALILSYLQWDVIPHRTVVGWLAYMTAVSAARAGIGWSFRGSKLQLHGAATAGNAFLAGTALSAAGWGGAGILLYPESDLVHQVFLVFVLGGMMVGGASVLAAKLETFTAFILLTGLPVSIHMLVQADRVHIAMGLLGALYNAATMVTAWRVHRTILSALRLRFENGSLCTSLLASKSRAEALSQKLITTRDDECRRVSRELHDGLNQTIGTLLIDAELLKRRLPLHPEISSQFQLLQTHITTLADDLRRILHQLHPAVLERMGLVAALQSLCAEFYDRDRLAVRFRHFNVPESIEPLITLCLYRVVQEGLNNVVKHSKSGRAVVVLLGDTTCIRLSVRDFGIGLSPNLGDNKGLGLLSMEERVRLVGGQFSVGSHGWKGTRIVVGIPLEASVEARTAAPAGG